MPITKEMIALCFDIYFTESQKIDPVLKLGMNERSARMTMLWFRCLFNGELYRRSASTMQIEWILNKLYDEKDYTRLRNTLISLDKYCDFYKNRPMAKVRTLVAKFQNRMQFIL